MTNAQRAALLDLAEAVLKCDCAPPDMRFRAQSLRLRLSYGSVLGSIFA